MLWETGAKGEEAEMKLAEFGLKISGAQAGMILSLASQNDAEDWLDETAKKVMRNHPPHETLNQ